jgi:hypothetical protein
MTHSFYVPETGPPGAVYRIASCDFRYSDRRSRCLLPPGIFDADSVIYENDIPLAPELYSYLGDNKLWLFTDTDPHTNNRDYWVVRAPKVSSR